MEIVGLLIAAGLGIWVYRDATERSAPQPAAWGIGTFLLAIIVLPIWFLKRPPKRSGSTRRCPRCAEEIQRAAVFCRFCGHEVGTADALPQPLPTTGGMSKGFKWALGIIGAFVGIVFLLGILVAVLDSRPSAAPSSGSTPSARPTPTAVEAPQPSVVERDPQTSPRPGLTMANYLRIAEGMTYPEVVEILGEPGSETSRVDLAGYSTVMYVWKRWTGANMNAMFQNGRLVSKAQFGLD